MDDLISRQDAIDAFKKEKPTPFVNKDGSVDPFGAGRQNQWYRDGIAIMNLPPAQQWIPVSSGLLPKAECGEGEDVLCQLENMRRIVLYFDGGNWCYPSGEPYIGVNYENRWSNRVVAWCELPEPWEGEGNEPHESI